MVHNIIGPLFNFKNCVFFVFGLFFFKNALFLQGEREFWKQKKNKKNGPLFNFKGKNGPLFNFTALYIYSCWRVSPLPALYPKTELPHYPPYTPHSFQQKHKI